MHLQSSSSQAIELIQSFRQNYINLHRLWTEADSIPAGAILRNPREEPIRDEDLPAGLRARLRAYRKSQPHEKLELLKYMHLVGGQPEVVIEDERALPDEDHLLVMGQTMTVNTKLEVEIITDILVARRG